MDIKDIPLIIGNFNQLTYLRNLINWWKWYYPENPVVIIDNGSTYEPLLDYCHEIDEIVASVHFYNENDFVNNLNDLISRSQSEYFIICDPDISPAPNTPPNFLEIFKHAIDHYSFHHAGFDLITEDIPDWNKKKGWIQGDEEALKRGKHTQVINYDGQEYAGVICPIDTTFALYKRDNGGWAAPQTAENWTNSLRLFRAHHLTWYIHPDHVNDEMRHYFATCKKFEPGQVSAGKNNYRP